MTIKLSQIEKASIVAPLVGPLVLSLIVSVFSGIYNSTSPADLLGIIFLIFLSPIPFVFFGAPIAWALTIFIALPLYLILKKLNFINYWSITLGGAFVAAVPVIYGIYDDYTRNRESEFFLYISFIFSGYVVGRFFWSYSGLKQSTHNKASNRIGAENAPPS